MVPVAFECWGSDKLRFIFSLFPFIAEMSEYIAKHSWSLLAILIITVHLEDEYISTLCPASCEGQQNTYIALNRRPGNAI